MVRTALLVDQRVISTTVNSSTVIVEIVRKKSIWIESKWHSVKDAESEEKPLIHGHGNEDGVIMD